MVGSQNAAGSWDGEVAGLRGRLRRPSFFVALALAALLAACAEPGTSPSASSLSTAPALPAVPVAILPGALGLAAKPPEPGLTGLTETDLLALYGEPDFRRAEPPAELWQYRSADCVLDVFLYHDVGGTRVVHTDTRDRSLIHAEPGRCTGGSIDSRIRQSRL